MIMKNSVGFVARLAGVGMAVAAAVVLTAGSAAAAPVQLTILKSDGSTAVVDVEARVGLGLGVLSPCDLLTLGVGTDVAASVLNLADIGVDGTVVACV
ncbi:hypothetical protein [Nocardia brasiliensis]|uniref:hypothetical protein n=1 Tax=Nocardia brasiliensis TaxID=37326 RepID=UPI003D944B6F